LTWFYQTSHHVQIYFYHLCLTYLLPEPKFHAADTAAIWLPPVEGFDVMPPSFDDVKPVKLSLLSSSINDFLFFRLPKLLAQPMPSVSWHLNPNCRGCPYVEDCSFRAIRDGELGSMPNISQEDVRVLRDLLRIAKSNAGLEPSGVSDIEDLGNILSNQPVFERLSRASPITMKKARKILAVPAKAKTNIRSPILDAATKNVLQVNILFYLTGFTLSYTRSFLEEILHALDQKI
jgi:hypothetical protein